MPVLYSPILRSSFQLLPQDFLSAFRRVKDALDTVYNDVAAMDKEVQNMSAQLQATRAQTHQLIENTMQLQSQRQELT